ncbi:MAG: Zn-dependent hydrolase [Chloroflexia bacterium]
MQRRTLIGGMIAGAMGGFSQAGGRIDAGRLQGLIEGLSVIGRPAGGTFSSGVSRVGYTDADVAGRAYVMDLMRKTGASVRVDAAGNIFASRKGREAGLPPLLFGSHTDSVPEGGNFDGVLGTLGAVEVLRVLGERGIETRRGVTAVVWACEEASFSGSSLNGSREAVGRTRPDDLKRVSRGITKAEGIRKVGGDPEKLEMCRIQRGDYHAYLELHIEQGGKLERARVPIGVVDGIVSIDDYEVVVKGMANHAGTTPMAERHDAMIAAAHMTLAVREIVMAEMGAQVGTVGHLEVSPNAVNVVPGEVRMSVELRDLSTAKLEKLGEKIRGRAGQIARETKTEIEMKRHGRNDAALADSSLQNAIEGAAAKLGFPTMHLPSGAGHDAQMMATAMPMGMIFVPSVGGISHSPRERTEWADCGNGANVLLETVLEMANG